MGERDRMAAIILPSSVLLFSILPHLSAQFPKLEVCTVMTASDWTSLGAKVFGEVSTFPPLARDSRTVIYFSKLPKGEYKYPGLCWGENPRGTACFFLSLQIIIFFALTRSVPFSQWQSHEDILPQKPFLSLLSVCSLKVVLFRMTGSFKVQGHK